METTRKLLNELARTLTDQYRQQLEVMPIKKNIREYLVDGFQAGAFNAAHYTAQMLGVTIHEEE